MKYSIRQLLIVTIPVALYFACVASATRGSVVGQGLAFAIPMIVIWFAAMAAVYWVAVTFSRVGNRWFGRGFSKKTIAGSPEPKKAAGLSSTGGETSSNEGTP